ncbi:hypothetical protein [Variovorax sp.]|uniref:hypothetical protein n=1 Tax=Variovorax sp. TaxID=1871043 RepID=UPI003BAAF127
MDMDWLTFATKLIEFLAWPATLIGLAIYLKRDLATYLKDLIPHITKFKAGPLEVEVNRLREKVEKNEAKTEAVVQAVEAVSVKLIEPDPTMAHHSDEPDFPTTSPFERKVIKAMGDSRFAMRSVTGLAKDTALEGPLVSETLRSLMSKRLVMITTNPQGQQRWFLTDLGTAFAISLYDKDRDAR